MMAGVEDAGKGETAVLPDQAADVGGVRVDLGVAGGGKAVAVLVVDG